MATPPETVASAVRAWRSYTDPLVVALDGHGAAGKSTLARGLREHLDVVVVHTDDFFRPREEQAAAAAADPRPMARYYDWQRLRAEALEPLRRGESVSFRAFDEAADSFRDELVTVTPADVIVLEGVSAAAPALCDLVDRTILVHTPAQQRLERLRELIPADAWDEQWLATELNYFRALGPGYFNLTVSGSRAERPLGA